MSNKSENELVDSFKSYAENNGIEILESNVYTKSKFDLVFIYMEYIVFAEVKNNKSTNKYNNALMFYGNIIRGRNYEDTKVKINKYCNKKVSYSLFVPYDNFFKRKVELISESDWKKFGEAFDCEYVFLFDDNSDELYAVEWNEFYLCKFDNIKNNKYQKK